MTILELRNFFARGTKFVLEYRGEEPDDDEMTLFEITNTLFGCSAFSSMEVMPYSIEINGSNVFIGTYMPYEVFKAWKNYAKENR